jgi:carbon monoxide dehydrogenase subunit G
VVAQSLIAGGVDVNAKANNGDTALTVTKDADVRALLAQAGAEP